jgi:uncharacterized RDD family membrane protein YckC
VAASSRRAGPVGLRRLATFLIDYLVLLVWMGGLFLASEPLGLGRLVGGDPARQHALAFLALTLPVLLYFALCEASPWRGTVGRRLAGLQVVREDGQRAGPLRTLARNGVKLAPWEIAHAALHRLEGWPQDPAPPGAAHWAAWTVALLLSTIWFTTAMIGSTPYDRLTGTRIRRRREGGRR